MKDKVLVTGGAGFIGSHLVDRLLKEGYFVRVLDNLSKPTHDGIPSYLSKEAEFLHGDVRNLNNLDRALQGISSVFHEAAAVGFAAGTMDYLLTNSCGTAGLLDKIASGKTSVKKLVVASSVAVYGEGSYRCASHGIIYPQMRAEKDLQAGFWEQRCPRCNNAVNGIPTDESKPVRPEHAYSLSKYDQERLVLMTGRNLGIHCAALRYFLTYGPRQSLRNPYTGICSIFSSQLVNGISPRIFEDGAQTRDFVFVGDVVNANLLVHDDARANGKVFNVGSGKATTILKVAQTLGKLLGRDIAPARQGEFRMGDVRHVVADISAIASLGYKPSVSLKEGLGRYVAWASEQGAIKDSFSQVYAQMKASGFVRKSRVETLSQ